MLDWLERPRRFKPLPKSRLSGSYYPQKMDRQLSFWVWSILIGMMLGLAIAMLLSGLWIATQALR